jgi:hypothetical protein
VCSVILRGVAVRNANGNAVEGPHGIVQHIWLSEEFSYGTSLLAHNRGENSFTSRRHYAHARASSLRSE